jgi:hypothetical protein
MFDFLDFLLPSPFQHPYPVNFSKATKFLFGSRVRPFHGSIARCDLPFVPEYHSGVVVTRSSFNGVDRKFEEPYYIVEFVREGDICTVSPEDFLCATAVCIYVACDRKTKIPLPGKSVGETALLRSCGTRNYNLLTDNCLQFSAGCITGNPENCVNLSFQLEELIRRKMNHGKSISWEIWNYEDDEAPSEDGLDERLEEECAELDHELIEGHEIACDDSVRPQLHDELRAWQQQMAEEMRQKFAGNFARLEAARASLEAGNHSWEDIQQDMQSYRDVDPNAPVASYEHELELRSDTDLMPLRMAVQADWRRNLEHQRDEYYQQEIQQRRALLLKELNGRLIAMPEITAELKQQMHEARERMCNFYALNIGSLSGRTIRYEDFDNEWQYDPGTMGIKELNGIVSSVAHSLSNCLYNPLHCIHQQW